MNHIKIQTELLKMMGKESYPIHYQEDEDNVYLVMDAARIFIIPQTLFFIDLKKLNRGPSTSLKTMLHPKGTDEGFFEGEIRQLSNGWTVKAIKSKKHTVWVNEKLLKAFGDVTAYKITNEKQPVYLYDGEILLGMILPVRTVEQ